jgi:prepilin-type N-terminal cleavage/methylation domain-containing protein
MSKSFTLIEILVVIVVVGVLSAFILVGMSSITNSANIAKGKAFSNSLKNSLLMSLIAEWKFNGGTPGNNLQLAEATDSWNNNNATALLSDPLVRTGTDCIEGNCLEYDGNDGVDFTPSINMDEFTMEMWMKDIGTSTNWSDFTQVWESPLDRRINFEYYTGAGISYVYVITRVDGAIYDAGTMIITPGYNHYVTTYSKSGNFKKTYKNGILIQSGTGWVGGFSSNSARTGFGTLSIIDCVKLYGSATTTQEIQEKYYSGLNKLFKNNGIALNEFDQRLTELKNSLTIKQNTSN